ncbi:MAG: GAF domain-containing protein [Polyangiaceae bacterium]
MAAEDALRARNHLYAMLARTYRAVSQCQTLQELFADVCEIAVETGRFRFAWIGVPEGDRIVPVARAGVDGGYIDAIRVSLDPADERSQGPAGRAFATGQSVVVNDFHTASMTSPWHDVARRVGVGATATFPIKEQGRPIAVLALYAAQRDYFDPDLLATLSEIMPSVSLGVDKLYQERERAREEAERRRIEEQFRQAQKMEAVGKLAAGVAHDFNNLLTIISGYSDPAYVELFDADGMREALGEIHRAGERAETLTRQLLTFSRRQVIEPKVLSLNAVVAETEKMLRRMIGEDVILTTRLDPALGLARVDPGQMSQILINLAVNARDAMPTGGQLLIETANVTLDEEACAALPGLALGPHVMLIVRDTGHGMNTATRARLFEPFFTTKGPGKGTGLGLATVLGIAQQANGQISVESEPGKGATFRVYLPRVPTQSEVPSVNVPSSLPTGSETVLLVEDQEALRTLAARVLRGCGYAVLEASNGREGVTVAEAHPGPIDLLVSDVVMPHLGGRQLVEKIQLSRPLIRVLLMSGYTDDALIQHGVEEAKIAFLRKPFTPSQLAKKVRGVLSEQR